MTDDVRVPQLLCGRYAVERLIGRGGMASVHLARDLKQDRRVAIKVLDPELASSISSDRFVREIGVASKLAHPNILPVHDSGVEEGLLFYVMPYVEGETLRGRLDREGQLPLEDALRLACEVAGALDYAHRQGVLHRDIKPDNILLEDGHAILADFGIARVLGADGGQKLTATGIALGTPLYMSPEQATGESRIDERSDVYSLACVLYEALAGEPPFTGPTSQSVLAKRLGAPPPRIRTVRSSVPESVERALVRAMDRTPADRFASAHAFADALAACARDDGAPTFARRLGAHRVAIAATAVVTLAAAIGAGFMLGSGGAARDSLPTVAVLPLTNQSRDPAHAYLAEGLTDAVIGDLTRTRGLRVIASTSTRRFGGGMAAMPAAGSTSAAMAAASSGSMPGGMSFMEGEDDGGAAAAPPPPAMPMGGRASLREVTRDLRADVLLQGTIARVGDSVSVSASLIRGTSLEQVWQGRFTRHVRHLADLQRDIVTAIVHVVGSADDATVAQASPPREYDPEANDAYIKGKYFQNHWKLDQAVTHFERAVQIDPAHALAQSGLSRAYYFLSFFGQLPPSIAVAGMRRAATAALEQDTLLAEAHAQMALVKMLQEWDWEGAERHFRRALELSPGDAQIRHDYAHFLLGQGRQRESAEQTEQALALDPANPMLISCLGWHSLFDGRYADAHRHAVEANELMPDQWAYVVLGWALLGEGKRDSAIAAFREARRLDERAFTLAALGHALAIAGREAEARATLDALMAREGKEYVSPYDIATVYAGLGDRDNAFRWLRRAADERSTFIVHVGWDARFDRIRADARFAELTSRQLRLPTPQFAALTAAERRGF